MIRDPLIQFMLTANMEQVLRIVTDDIEVIEVAFDDAQKLEDIGKAFIHRALMLRTAATFDFDFDETLKHFDKVEQTFYDDDIVETDIDSIIDNILGEE